MRLGELESLWGAPIGVERPNLEARLGPVCTDSRSLSAGQCFVPLVGDRFDGHTFLVEAQRLGAQAALVERRQLEKLPAGLLAWVVDDTLVAYQQLACLWRQSLAIPVVAVTGSAGKTTTRELLRAALEPLGPVLASRGNENNDVGVPATLLRAGAEHRAVVL